jgi:hypothetical protein
MNNEIPSLKSQLGVNISAFQLGKDFNRLRRLLSKFPVFHNATIVGPDINSIGGCQNKVNEPDPDIEVMKFRSSDSLA